MLDRFRSIVVGLSVIVLVALISLYLVVQIGGGEDIFGESEGSLQPVDFALLDYSPDDSGYLLCPEAACGQAVPDGVSPLFLVDQGRLRQLFVDFADANPTVNTFRFDLRTSQFDFTEKMPGQPFPAVVTVKIIKVDDYSSTAAIYSRQPVGGSDKSDHMERVTRWLRVLLETANGSTT